jgi:hypothetical protein
MNKSYGGAKTQEQWLDDRLKLGADNVNSILESGGPDIGLVLGAPNEYEEELRHALGATATQFYGRQDSAPEVMVVPDEEYAEQFNDSIPEETEIQGPNIDLHTTIDDWESALSIASEKDTIDAYTSDYHSPVVHAVGRAAHDEAVNTFGASTNTKRRESILKHNAVTQTLANGPRQLYKAAKRDML